MSVIIQSNLQMGFGTILSNLYECILISQRLRGHNRTLYVNCSITFYFDSSMFKKVFNMDYLKTQFDDVIVSDEPYKGEVRYFYTRDSSVSGKHNWDIFTMNSDLKIHYDHRYGLPNKFSFTPDRISIQGDFDIFSDYVKSQYRKLPTDYACLSYRGKNMTDSSSVINHYLDSFNKIVSKNNLTYVCGTSSILKNKLMGPKVYFNEMYINEEDFLPNVYDDEKLKQLVLLCLDMLHLKDSEKIYHYTYFNQISYFLFIPFINKVPIETISLDFTLGK